MCSLLNKFGMRQICETKTKKLCGNLKQQLEGTALSPPFEKDVSIRSF
jgi:hypothetical protein